MVAPRELVYPAQPVISAGGRIIAAPFQFVTRGDDHLRVVSANSASGVELRIAGRRYSEQGDVLPLDFRHTPNTDRSTKTENFALGAGAILNVTVSVSSGAPLVGQTFVILQLIQGLASSAIVIGTIMAGYVTAVQPLAFPGSAVVPSTSGEPFVRAITGAAPAVDTDIVETVPTGARWELLSIRAQFTQPGGAVAGPVFCLLDDGSSAYAHIGTQNVGGAGTVNQVGFGVGLTNTSVNILGGVLVGNAVPGNRLLAGHRIRLVRTVSGAGQQWSAPIYNVREWLEVAA